jgi:hypothetical protein
VNKAATSRLALALGFGALTWVLYRGAWGVSRYINGFAHDPDYPLWEHAPEVLGFVATAALAEFVICCVVAALVLLAIGRFRRRGGAVLAGIVAAMVVYLMNAAAFLALPSYLSPESITLQSFLPGLKTIAHLTAAAFVGALMWRIAYGGAARLANAESSRRTS